MFGVEIEDLENNRGQKFLLIEGDRQLGYGEVINLWQCDRSFRSFFITLFNRISFDAYCWETPPITHDNLERTFEFVIIDSPNLIKPPSYIAFKDFIAPSLNPDSIVVFPNLGKDAILLVPSPQTASSAYGHLATFFKNAPETQQQTLWQMVGREMKQRVGQKPIWLNTAGAGVPWLHIRLDSRPKYYKYRPYTKL